MAVLRKPRLELPPERAEALRRFAEQLGEVRSARPEFGQFARQLREGRK